ncbi:MAG: 4-hydroxy-tetrahydrodipicolinate reductase, partial [Candidatus Kapaibacteriota bacterium]
MTTEKPKIALVGYGKMGKEIERLALEKGFILTDIFDIDKPLIPDRNYDFEVAIEFTTPTAVFENIKAIAKMKKNIVVGTTGWYDKLEAVKQIVEQEQIGLIFSPNFSIGIQILLKTIEQI